MSAADPLLAWLHALAASTLWLAVHLVVATPFGAALAAASRGASRRRRAARARAAVRLCRAAPWCVGVALVGAALQSIGATSLVFPAVAPIMLGAPATAGCYLMVCAGRTESRGRLRNAKRETRFAGMVLFAGALLLPVAEVALQLPPVPRLAGGGLTIGAGIAGLLAGLSGKPRPTGTLAVLLHVAGVAARIHAASGN